MKTLPNLIYILADDMGYGDISSLNKNSALHTRHIDRLASEGLSFTDAHASSAVCTPSRYSILTGRYNWRSELKEGVLWGDSAPLIEKDRLTAASMLKQSGYRTACIGKWHLGLNWSTRDGEDADIDFAGPVRNGPLDYGFDYFFGVSASLDMPPYVYIENDAVTALPDRVTKRERTETSQDWWREGPTGADFNHTEVLPKLTEKVLEKIDEYRESPFFIYFPMTAPHTPILPAEEFAGKSGTNPYGDFVLMCDDAAGKIMAKLEENGMAENTIIIYTSDNGCSPEADYETLARYGHNPSYVFRGHKADIYEGGHRIPLIVRWPEQIHPGRVSPEPVCLSDLIRTMADITGYSLPDNAGEDSVSNLPLWLGQETGEPIREAVVHHSVNGSFSIRKGKWKLELCPGSGGWSYPKPGEEPPGSPPVQLYDLENDIGERQNLCDAFPEVVESLRSLLKTYVETGRSTPGAPQKNTGPAFWDQLQWMKQ
jgi:arylsulfatase A-like enzyme